MKLIGSLDHCSNKGGILILKTCCVKFNHNIEVEEFGGKKKQKQTKNKPQVYALPPHPPHTQV